MQEWDKQQAELPDDTVEKKMMTTGQSIIDDLDLEESEEETPENSGGALLLGVADNGGSQSNGREIIEKGRVRLDKYRDMSYETYYIDVTEDESRYPVFDDHDPKTTATYRLKVTKIKTYMVPENFVERYNNREFKLVSGQYIDFNDTDILVASDNLNYVQKNAFKGLKKLQMVVLPACYHDIGESAFENCSKLWYAGGFSRLQQGKIVLGSRAFANCATNSPDTDNTLYFDCGFAPELEDKYCTAPFEGTKKTIGIAFIRRKTGLNPVEYFNEFVRLIKYNKVIKPWGCDLPDDALICNLSIPGSHDAATYKCENTNGDFGGYARTQGLSLSGQWKQGVRFFDLRVTHPVKNDRSQMKIKHGEATCYGIGSNGKKVVLTLHDAIKEIADEVYQSGDFAIIQITHQNEKGDECKSFNKDRNDYDLGDRAIQEELAKWKTTYTSPVSHLPSYKNVAADYVPGLITERGSYGMTRVKDLRGKILFIHNVPNDCSINANIPVTGCWGSGLEVISENSGDTKAKDILTSNASNTVYMQNLAHANAEEKLEAVQTMFRKYAERKAKSEPAYRLDWGFNYTSGYRQSFWRDGVAFPNYPVVAEGVNGQVADIINGMSAGTPIGFTIMDYAGAEWATKPGNSITYHVNGDKLLDAVIKHNFK